MMVLRVFEYRLRAGYKKRASKPGKKAVSSGRLRSHSFDRDCGTRRSFSDVARRVKFKRLEISRHDVPPATAV